MQSSAPKSRTVLRRMPTIPACSVFMPPNMTPAARAAGDASHEVRGSVPLDVDDPRLRPLLLHDIEDPAPTEGPVGPVHRVLGIVQLEHPPRLAAGCRDAPDRRHAGGVIAHEQDLPP